MRRGVT